MNLRGSDPRFQKSIRGNGKAASRRLSVKPRIGFRYCECSCFSAVLLVFDVVALTMQNRSRRLYGLTVVDQC